MDPIYKISLDKVRHVIDLFLVGQHLLPKVQLGLHMWIMDDIGVVQNGEIVILHAHHVGLKSLPGENNRVQKLGQSRSYRNHVVFETFPSESHIMHGCIIQANVNSLPVFYPFHCIENAHPT